MDEIYVSALEDNPNIDADLKKVVIDSFRSVFYTLGEYGFMRWIDMANMPERLKILIVEEFNAEDLIRYSNCSGYFSGSGLSIDPDKIKVRDKRAYSVSDTLKHEDLHFFSKGWEIWHLGKFQGEGVIQYLKILTSIPREKRNMNYYSSSIYKENVDYINFITQVIGYEIIRAGFDFGYIGSFEKLMASYITDSQEDMEGRKCSDIYEDYKKKLDKIHKYLHPVNEEEEIENRKLEKEVVNELYPQLKEIIVNIMVHSIRIKARNLDYYSDGVFQADNLEKDLKRCIDIVNIALVSKQRFNLSWQNQYTIDNFISRDIFEKRALEAALIESGIDSSKISEVVDLYMKNRFSIRDEFSENCTSILGGERASILKRVLDKKIPKDKEWGISEYFMTVANIMRKMGIKGNEIQFVVDSILVRYLPPNISPKIAKQILGNHLEFFSELYRINQDSINNIYDIKFVKMGENQFVECRDNVLYYVEFNPKEGNFEYTLISPDAETIYNNSDNKENITTFRTPGKSVIQHTLTYTEKFWSVHIDGKRCWPICSVEELGNSYLVDALIHPIKENIDNGKYVTKLNDAYPEDVDTLIDGVEYSAIVPDHSSLIVNFKMFAQDLLECTESIAEKDRSDVIEEAYRYLFNEVFYCIPSNVQKITDLSKILEEPISKSMQDELLKCMAEANQKRREHIDSLITINNVRFSSDEAQKRYTESIKTKQKKKERVLVNQMIRAFVEIEAKDAISEPAMNDSFDLNDENIFISGANHFKKEPNYSFPTARKVDYNKFFELLKKQLEEVPQGKRKEFIKRTINDSVFMWYGGSVDYPILSKNNIVERKNHLISGLVEIFNGYAAGDESVDISQTEDIENELINLSNETYILITQKRRKKIIEFQSNSAEVTYHTVDAIRENPDLSDEQKRLLINTVVQNNNRIYQKDQSMKAFMKLALAGDNIPTQEDVQRATELLDLYKDKVPE